jgi:hypothetical protein
MQILGLLGIYCVSICHEVFNLVQISPILCYEGNGIKKFFDFCFRIRRIFFSNLLVFSLKRGELWIGPEIKNSRKKR